LFVDLICTHLGQLRPFFSAQDGTINYLLLPAITSGLHLLSAYLPFLPLRLNCLVHYLVAELGKIRHRDWEGRMAMVGGGGVPVCRVLSRVPGKVLKAVGETDEEAGAVVACIFLDVSCSFFVCSFLLLCDVLYRRLGLAQGFCFRLFCGSRANGFNFLILFISLKSFPSLPASRRLRAYIQTCRNPETHSRCHSSRTLLRKKEFPFARGACVTPAGLRRCWVFKIV
jgi:hypothetical protein